MENRQRKIERLWHGEGCGEYYTTEPWLGLGYQELSDEF